MNYSEQRRWAGGIRGAGLGIIVFCVFLYIVRGGETANIPSLVLLGAIGFVTFFIAHIALKKEKPEGSGR